MAHDGTRIAFERSGGFGGVTLSTSVDTRDLDAEEAAAIEELVERIDLDAVAAAPRPAGGADRFQFDLTVERGGRRQSVSVGETALTPELKELCDRMLEMARRR